MVSSRVEQNKKRKGKPEKTEREIDMKLLENNDLTLIKNGFLLTLFCKNIINQVNYQLIYYRGGNTQRGWNAQFGSLVR